MVAFLIEKKKAWWNLSSPGMTGSFVNLAAWTTLLLLRPPRRRLEGVSPPEACVPYVLEPVRGAGVGQDREAEVLGLKVIAKLFNIN